MNIVIGALVKNEADRFLPSALEVWNDFADRIVVLDDRSEDATKEVAENAGAIVYERGSGMSAWGAEAPARAELWERLLAESAPGDWLFVLDADMCPMKNPRPLFETAKNAVLFRLYDLWHETDEGTLLHRTGGHWQAHRFHRMWAVKRPEEEPDEGWLWSDRGIHTGHFPTNLPLKHSLHAPRDHSLLHFAYITSELREAKAAAYESVASKLTAQEQQHAISILHPKPQLARVPEGWVDYKLRLE